MKQLTERIQQYIIQHNLISPGSTVILGLSGGPDSVFLLHVLDTLQTPLNFKLIAAHLNHGWRAEANAEQAFCKQLADAKNIQFIAAQARDIVLTRKQPRSQEAQGRALRRAFFEKCAQEHTAAHIALAHHADDQLETFFIRLIRGATLSGLKGMVPQTDKYIRPLLAVTKQEILAALQSENIPYCTDASNNSDAFLRNRIRKYVMPALQQCDSRLNTLSRSVHHLHDAHSFIEELTEAAAHECIITVPEGTVLDYHKLGTFHTYLQKNLILKWLIQANVPFTPSTALLEEILRFLSHPTAQSHTLYGTWHIKKHKNNALLAHKS